MFILFWACIHCVVVFKSVYSITIIGHIARNGVYLNFPSFNFIWSLLFSQIMFSGALFTKRPRFLLANKLGCYSELTDLSFF